jgi:hypothetical protein
MDFAEHRKHLVEWVRAQLTGRITEEGRKLGISPPGRRLDPERRAEILLDMSPMERFPVGVLHPVFRDEEGIDPASEAPEDEDDEASASQDADETSTEPVIKRRRYVPPSSVGFSFFVRGEKTKFQVLYSAVRYEMVGKIASGDYLRDEKGRFSNAWSRIQVHDASGGMLLFSPPDRRKGGTAGKMARDRKEADILEGRAGVDVIWRPFEDGWITTVSLFNKAEISGEESLADSQILTRIRNERALFEIELSCVFDAGEVGLYPRVDESMLTEEEQELELRYKERHIYAVGHGAAVDWKCEGGGGPVKEIWAEFLPAVEVPQVTADLSDQESRTLQLAHLASLGKPGTTGVFDELDEFIARYAAWVTTQKSFASRLPSKERGPAGRIVERMSTAVLRMRQGLSLLRKDSRACQAFGLANQAMLDQMMQHDLIQKREKAPEAYRWRPFQLAFLLCEIESVVHEESDFRDTVGLIWFPTGGGKTEAYLGLTAFLMFWRRLTNPASGNGTVVIMRYTLRLLTAQQYQRATRMICALELLRRKDPSLGREPFTVGMWIGAETTPNTLRAAKEAIDRAANGGGLAAMELVLSGCPWCGEPFKAPGSYGISAVDFHFRCTNPDCAFGRTPGGAIPCNVVDEVLYAKPPALLIATIDKFARLAWEERANAFFGRDGNRPPELVIQDELHLIAGALGTIAGLYEAALDTVLVRRGIHPKYIASTATIRNADQQVNRLYGKKVAVFPPPGLCCDDSYFARTVPLTEKPGRLFVGYLAPLLRRQPLGNTTSGVVPLAALLFLAPHAVFHGQADRESLLEAWWTQVVYHGSLKGVGNSHNAYANDVHKWLKRYYDEWQEAIRSQPGADLGDAPEPRAIRVAQLTSLSSAEENARTFARLERTREEPESLDAVLATNMISVGLDVARLALMIVNGQPLTTAEFIQTSSRVGRSDVPGLVFVNYYRDQARSLSHYENFRPYHESFYRFVEPTSVTPYTYQARCRALHAALVIAVRHSCRHLLLQNSAGDFDPSEPLVAKTVETLKNRCRQADGERACQTDAHLDRLVEEWKAEADLCKRMKRQLFYSAPAKSKSTDRLLYNHNDTVKGRWATLQSMRNVEDTALVKTI